MRIKCEKCGCVYVFDENSHVQELICDCGNKISLPRPEKKGNGCLRYLMFVFICLIFFPLITALVGSDELHEALTESYLDTESQSETYTPSTQSTKPQQNEPSQHISLRPNQKYRISKVTFGFTTKEMFNKALQLLEQGEDGKKFIISHSLTGEAWVFEKGLVVWLMDLDMFGDMALIRLDGESTEYWIPASSLTYY